LDPPLLEQELLCVRLEFNEHVADLHLLPEH
jgi:hypothetical protein